MKKWIVVENGILKIYHFLTVFLNLNLKRLLVKNNIQQHPAALKKFKSRILNCNSIEITLKMQKKGSSIGNIISSIYNDEFKW